MRSISVHAAIALLVCSCASSQAPAASSPTASSTSAKSVSKQFVLLGSDGVKVEVVDLEDGQALLRVTGIESPLQNKVVSHRRAREGNDLLYKTQWAGRDWLTLLRSGESAWIGTYWRLSVPGNEAIPVAYSEQHSDKVDVDSLFAAYEAQQRSGELDQLQQWNRSAERSQEDELVTTSTGVASSECASPLRAAIAWDTVSDEALREHSVSDYCLSAIRALKGACFASPELKTFVQKQIKEVSCRYDGQGDMTLDAGRLTWSMNVNLSDIDTAANRALARLYAPDEETTASAAGSQ